jgi:TolA-binding protein
MSALACPDSLVARARTGSLSLPERSQLQLHLRHCEACRVSLLVGRDFDAALAAQSDDTLFVSQVVSAVRASRAARASGSMPVRGGRSKRRLLVYGVAAALLTSSFVVGAASPALRHRAALFIGVQAAKEQGSPPTARIAAASVKRVSSSAKPELVAASPQALLPAEEEPAPAAHDEHSVAVESAPARDGRSARDMFAQANAERRAGDLPGATRLYQELQQRHPHSREAEVSRVTVGRLLLERSQDPKSALEQFDRALNAPGSDHAGLGEEALFGRASALMRLGRTDDERKAWRQLLQQFPGSIYADRAHARLAELSLARAADGLGNKPAQQ